MTKQMEIEFKRHLTNLLVSYPSSTLSPDEITTMARTWAEDVGDEISPALLRECFRQVRKSCRFFPTLADLYACRDQADRERQRRMNEGQTSALGAPPSGSGEFVRKFWDHAPGATAQELRDVVAGMCADVGYELGPEPGQDDHFPSAGEMVHDNRDYLGDFIALYYPNLGCLSASQLRGAVRKVLANRPGVLPDEVEILLAHGRAPANGRMRKDYGQVMNMYAKRKIVEATVARRARR